VLDSADTGRLVRALRDRQATTQGTWPRPDPPPRPRARSTTWRSCGTSEMSKRAPPTASRGDGRPGGW
jgi:hypothetical protein